MNPAAPFIGRPVATTLLTFGIFLAGAVAFCLLPVSPLPQVDFPTISVQAQMPGASPETMATSVATPLERHLGQIADVTEMTSQSAVGTARITLQFGLDRNVDGAARDVEAAINAARADLPTALRSNPTYRKVNPADAPIMILALTSDTLTAGQMYDAADSVLMQQLSSVPGIGQVTIGGSSLPAVRAELNPKALFRYGIGLEDVRAALASANANSPKGDINISGRRYQIYTNDQARKAAQYQNLIIAYRDNAPVRLKDVADVSDSVENIRNEGLADGKPSVLVILFKEPNANIISTIQAVNAQLPMLRAAIPAAINIEPAMDASTSIRTSLRDVERTLLIAVGLVVLVVFLFLRNGRATLVPIVAVPVSLVGTFGVMYLLGFSLNNLSMMALIVGTGFVVDDAIVVLENISRHIEEGVPRYQAALQGAREVSFTVLSMSLSLVAVFIPILMMGGIIGRLFREFAVTLSVAILVSLAVSLTTTPMMCARILKEPDKKNPPPARAAGGGDGGGGPEPLAAHSTIAHDAAALPPTPLPLRRQGGEVRRRGFFQHMTDFYGETLHVAIRYWFITGSVLIAVMILTVYLYIIVPKGFFPQQDIGRMMGSIQADQSISFQSMKGKLEAFVKIVHEDPAVEHVVGFTGGQGATNTGMVFAELKPIEEHKSINEAIAYLRKVTTGVPGAQLLFHNDDRSANKPSTVRDISIDQVIARIRKKTASVSGAQLFFQAAQDIHVGGRSGSAQYQYTLQSDDLTALRQWSGKITAALQKIPDITDVNSDQQQKGLETELTIDRNTASRLGLTATQIDNTLYDAFGQRQVSTIYNPLNQYHVIMEVAPQYWQSPDTLNQLYVSTAGGAVGGTQGTNAVAGTFSGVQANGAASTAPTAASVASDTARNASLNAIAQSGHGSASTGAAVSSSVETMIPLSAFSSYAPGTTALSINHQGLAAATTISFNLAPGKSLSDATADVDKVMTELHVPSTVQGHFAGTAQTYQESLKNEPILIAAALAAVYIVLGILYESYVHPITILSTLPSAGAGAVLALMVTNTEFSLIALIGVLLLVGIVKKNAIMMVDVAIAAEREQGMNPRDAIFHAAMLRFRPIMMTTAVALFSAVPLAIGGGEGAELRTPLGISIVGGLLVSQLLTLYTTPVIYLGFETLRQTFTRKTDDTAPHEAAALDLTGEIV